MAKRRARELGLDFPGQPGPLNAITDVPGVEVGFTTLIRGKGDLVVGKGPVRTGVTAILPRGKRAELAPTWAGYYALNGNGEMTGTHWIQDAGYFESPICITNTHSVGIVHHAILKWMFERYAGSRRRRDVSALPVVAETYDGTLNDINGQHVRERHVIDALERAAGGAVPEGNVGGGTGMICYDFKGGTGTASRRFLVGRKGFTLGALVQANHGRREWLSVLGVPVGRHLGGAGLAQKEQGSVIVVLGTDAPMLPHQLTRVAKRAAIGIGRNGTVGGNGSGDIFLAFSVANEMSLPRFASPTLGLRFVNDEHFDPIYLAAVEATEEAVVNAMLAAEDMTTVRSPRRVCRAIDHDALLEVMRRYKRCA